jgi:hypothetical protein
VKKPTLWAFDYLPAAFCGRLPEALIFCAVAGAVTVTLAFGAVAGLAIAELTFGVGFATGCDMIIFLMRLLLNDQMHLLLPVLLQRRHCVLMMQLLQLG